MCLLAGIHWVLCITLFLCYNLKWIITFYTYIYFMILTLTLGISKLSHKEVKHFTHILIGELRLKYRQAHSFDTVLHCHLLSLRSQILHRFQVNDKKFRFYFTGTEKTLMVLNKGDKSYSPRFSKVCLHWQVFSSHLFSWPPQVIASVSRVSWVNPHSKLSSDFNTQEIQIQSNHNPAKNSCTAITAFNNKI